MSLHSNQCIFMSTTCFVLGFIRLNNITNYLLYFIKEKKSGSFVMATKKVCDKNMFDNV